MAVRYPQSGQAEEAGFLLTGGQIDDDSDDGWWAGTQRCFARVALATALAASTFTAAIANDLQQDLEEIPAGSLKVFSTPDEDYWQNPVAPVPLSIYQQLPYCRLDPEELPAGSLLKFPSPDEDFWDNPLSPIATANYQKLPYQPEPEELPAGSLLKFPSPDEDYWGLGAGCWGLGKPPVIGPNPQFLAPGPQTLYLPDPSDDPAGSLRGQPDEDYWQNPVPCGTGQNPVAPALYQRLPYLPDVSDDPAASLRGQPDEDYLQNPVAPVPPSVYQKLPILPDLSDDPAGSLHGQPDEDFWANPVAPVPPTLYQRLPYLPELSDEPAGSLAKFTSPDEDYWQLPQIAQISQTALALYQPLPITASEPADIIPPPVVFQPDEDFWQSAVAPVPPCGPKPSGGGPPALYGQLPYLPEVSDDPAGSLYGQPDEDFWANPVPPLPPSIYQKLPLLDLSDDPAGSLYGQPDEDFWLNPVAPVPPTLYQALPIAAGEVGETVSQVEEEYWENAVAPIPPCGPKPSGGGPPALYGQLPYLPDVSDEPAGSLLKCVSPDEDYWPAFAMATAGGQNLVPPGLPGIYQPLPYASGETAEIPPQTLLPSDEDFWQNPVAPAPPAFYQRLPYLPDLSDDPAGLLAKFSSPDEDYPQVAQITQTAQNLVPAFADSGEAPGPAFQPDEDYWPLLAATTGGWQNPQIAQITQTGRNVWLQPWTFESPEPAGSLCGQPDEDFWANPAAPVPPCGPKPSGGGPPALYGQLPYLPEVSDDPAGSLYGQPDEDFWVNPVAPAPPRIYQQLPYLPDICDEPAGSPHGVPEETEWQNWVAPSPLRPWQPLPYLPELSDDPAGSLRILAEETEWLNSVAPVAAKVFQLLPYASGEAAEFLPAVVSDEDCWPPLAIATGGWQNPIVPAQAARTWMQPAVYGFDEFSSFWWSSTWGVRTHSTARGQVSHSAARERISRSTARPRTSRGISRQSSVVSPVPDSTGSAG